MHPSIPLFKVFMAPESELLPRLRDVLYSGQISEGAPVYEFEQRFGAFTGHPAVLSFSSGTVALHTALFLAGVKAGDEVVSTPMTAEPTNMAICHAGGRPVWADIDRLNGNVTAASIEEAITPKTRAIIVVHYGGVPAPMKAIREVAQRHGLPIVEDAAHALGARYCGAPIGQGADYCMFSLQAIKHMTTIDGGMLACKAREDLPRGRVFRWFGIDRQAVRTEVDVAQVGYKYHMNNVTATIGLVQLEHAAKVIARHVANGRFFDQALRRVGGLKSCEWEQDAEPSYWFYTVLAERRDDLAKRLTEKGIANSMVHRRNDLHSVFAASKRELPGLDAFYSRVLHIPCGWWVTDEDREYIADVMRQGW
jgi:dTDP-4-amino-4,6-dideoxygalactose transaminase